jgi:hypothetical protein
MVVYTEQKPKTVSWNLRESQKTICKKTDAKHHFPCKSKARQIRNQILKSAT